MWLASGGGELEILQPTHWWATLAECHYEEKIQESAMMKGKVPKA